MSYESQWKLTYDDGFRSRGRAAFTIESLTKQSDSQADIAALAKSLLLGEPSQIVTFLGILGASPGFDTTVDNGDGTVDSTKISDSDILSAVQSNFAQVASLFYASDGTALSTV